MKPALQILPETVSIRLAAAHDAGVIHQLAHSIWPVCFKDIILPHQIANMLEKIYSIESLRQQMQEGQAFWVAYQQEVPVGYVSAYKDKDTVWIKKLYLEPHCQGKGIGTKMMGYAVAAFLPASDICLFVARDNVMAQNFYVRSGFTRAGEQPVKMGDFDFIDYIYRKPIQQEA